MAAGRPVVATRGVPWPEIERERAGFWVDADVPSIANALTALLADTAAAEVMGERGRALIQRSYSWPAVVRDLTSAYQRALSVERVS
jgi:glycosyltransferase involved in cell wall biosynthesis